MKDHSSMENFKTSGYVNVAYPADLRSAVIRATESWVLFSQLPLEIKKLFPYNNSSMGVGYECKETEGSALDLKENFDLTRGDLQWVAGAAATIRNPIVSDFIENAGSLIQTMSPLVLDFAQRISNTYSIPRFRQEVKSSIDTWFVRFIHYPGGRKKGDKIATPHVDQSGFTLHLYESDPGLQCFTYDRKWRNMPVSEGETVIIPNMQLQLKSEGNLKAMCHRVVATKKTAVTGRFSAVCFIAFKNTPKYNKKEFGRLQKYKPGFNYKMRFKKFSELFKK